MNTAKQALPLSCSFGDVAFYIITLILIHVKNPIPNLFFLTETKNHGIQL